MKKNLMAAHAAAALDSVRPELGGPLTQEVVGSARVEPIKPFKSLKKIALSPGERVRENAMVKRMGGVLPSGPDRIPDWAGDCGSGLWTSPEYCHSVAPGRGQALAPCTYGLRTGS